jgi:predicted RNA-binding protein with PIN domain
MALLIDGYNLLHVSGIFGREAGPATLERSRSALLNCLAAAVDPHEIEHTTVVFDAADAPPGLPRTVKYRGMTVRYAAQYADADALIEELIRADSAPKRLIVVSSDHRIQRAARRRKAIPIDSDSWYADLIRQRKVGRQAGTEFDIKPAAPLSDAEVQWWLKEFGEVASLAELGAEKEDAACSPQSQPPHQQAAPSQPSSPDIPSSPSDASSPSEPPASPRSAADDLKPSETAWQQIANPFPPGYAEDLLDDSDARRKDRRDGNGGA